jgi:hypothetical protein
VSYTTEDTVTATATTPAVLKVKLTDEWAKNAMARAVPGSYWDTEARAHMVIDPSPRAAAVILRLFPELGVKHPELQERRDELLQDMRPFDFATPFGNWISKHSDRRSGAAPRRATASTSSISLASARRRLHRLVARPRQDARRPAR